MKTLAQIDSEKLHATGKASDVGRQLAFAGLAVVWILREATDKPLGEALVEPLLWFVACLLLDLLQYVWCSFVWTIFYNYQYEKHESDDARIDIPGAINWVSYGCFWLKILCLLLGWGALADAAIAKWQIFS